MINPLVEAFSAIELLIKSDYSAPLNTVESFDYLSRYGQEDNPQSSHKLRKTISTWVEELLYVQQHVKLAPNFKVWDENTREIDQAVETAINRATVVFAAITPPCRRLPKHIVNGIYARIEVLQRWRNEFFYPTRSREDYQLWKREQDLLEQQEERSEIRNPPDGLMSLVGRTLISFESVDAPNTLCSKASKAYDKSITPASPYRPRLPTGGSSSKSCFKASRNYSLLTGRRHPLPLSLLKF